MKKRKKKKKSSCLWENQLPFLVWFLAIFLYSSFIGYLFILLSNLGDSRCLRLSSEGKRRQDVCATIVMIQLPNHPITQLHNHPVTYSPNFGYKSSHHFG